MKKRIIEEGIIRQVGCGIYLLHEDSDLRDYNS